MPTAERSLEQPPSEHTPGPWRAGGNHVFAGTSWGWIASTDSPYVSALEPTANARLIAAAPDMLAVCVAVDELSASPHAMTGPLWEIVDAARAAIAKAKGEQ